MLSVEENVGTSDGIKVITKLRWIASVRYCHEDDVYAKWGFNPRVLNCSITLK